MPKYNFESKIKVFLDNHFYKPAGGQGYLLVPRRL